MFELCSVLGLVKEDEQTRFRPVRLGDFVGRRAFPGSFVRETFALLDFVRVVRAGRNVRPTFLETKNEDEKQYDK